MRIISWWGKQCRWLWLHTINSSEAVVICCRDIFIAKVRCCRCCRMHSSHRRGPSRSAVLCHRLWLRLLFQRDLWDLILEIRLTWNHVSVCLCETWPGNSVHVAAVTVCLKWCLHYFFPISLSLRCCYGHYGWKSSRLCRVWIGPFLAEQACLLSVT